MKLLKVLTHDMRPPIQGGEAYEIGKEYVCQDFDESDKECSRGYYGIPIDEIIKYYCPNEDTRLFECIFGGKSKYFSAEKQRYETMTILRELSKDEILALCRENEERLGYKLAEALFPVNPLELKKRVPNKDDLRLMKEWSSVWDSVRSSVGDSVRDYVWSSVWDSVWSSVGDSVWYSVWDSVWSSVGDSVGDSVWDSVGDSVRYSVMGSVGDSVWAYMGSLFPNIKKWKYFDHPESTYPFQAVVDLWNRGLVPSFDGDVWRLHSGANAEVVWQGNIKDIKEVTDVTG